MRHGRRRLSRSAWGGGWKRGGSRYSFMLYLGSSFAVLHDWLFPRYGWLMPVVLGYCVAAAATAVFQWRMVRSAKHEYSRLIRRVATEPSAEGLTYAFLLCRLPFDKKLAKRFELLIFCFSFGRSAWEWVTASAILTSPQAVAKETKGFEPAV